MTHSTGNVCYAVLCLVTSSLGPSSHFQEAGGAPQTCATTMAATLSEKDIANPLHLILSRTTRSLGHANEMVSDK